MKERRTKNKRLMAGVIALAVLVVTLVGNNMAKSLKSGIDGEKLYKDSFSSVFESRFSEKILLGEDENNRIMVIPIKGVIGAVGFGEDGYRHKLILESLDQAIYDLTINGIILQVDSPGGAVYESAEVYRKIKEVQEERDIPVYVSMGGLAASGGYYVSAPADKIYAARETITGSIGVISSYLNYEELAEKIGIKYEVFKSGKHKDIGSSNREMTDEEKRINQEMIDIMYKDFIDIIAEGREGILTRDEILKLADGRVYLGAQAVENGLIDELGYFEDVLDDLSEVVRGEELLDPQVFTLSTGSTLFDDYFGGLGFSSKNTDFLDLFLHLESTGEKYGPNIYYLYGGN